MPGFDMLNDFYINVTSHIDVPDAIKENDSVRSEIVEHHCNHPSIEFIKNNVEIMDTIVFDLVSDDVVLKKLKSLNTTKATGYDNIRPKMIKMVADCTRNVNVACEQMHQRRYFSGFTKKS